MILHTIFMSAIILSAEPLTWDACLKKAIECNADLRAVHELKRAADHQASGAWSAFLPQLSTALAYSYSKIDNGASSQTEPNYSVSLSATQNLFAGLQDLGKLQQTQANRLSALANLDGAKAKLSYELKSAFAAALFAQDSLRLTRSIIQRRRNNFRMVALRFESGRENKGSVLLSKAYLDQAEFEYLQAEHDLEIPRQQLSKLLGSDLGTADFKGPIPTPDPVQNTSFTQLASETPAFRTAKAQANAAEAGYQIARSALFPSLNLSGNLGEQGPSFWPDRDRWSFGVSLSVPLFSGGKNYFATRSAAFTLSAASLTRSSIHNQQIVALKEAYFSFIEAIAKLKADESFLAAARVREEIAKSKYNNGLLSFDDWDIIENDTITREKAVLKSARDRVIAAASWEHTQGKGAIP